jgi:DNA-binding LacI/PurR family transcriptional regulator
MWTMHFCSANLPKRLPAVLLNSAVKSEAYGVSTSTTTPARYAMVRHLLDVGHKNVAFITGPEKNFDAEQREKGYRAAMANSLQKCSEISLPVISLRKPAIAPAKNIAGAAETAAAPYLPPTT